MSADRPARDVAPETPRGDVLLGEQYYILASEIAADLPKLVLKHDEAFLVANRRGDLPNMPDSEFGFYVDGTRFLRQLELRVHGHRPIVLNAGVAEDAMQATIDLTNPDVLLAPQVLLPGRSLRIARRTTVHAGQLYQLLLVEAFTREPHELSLTLSFAADFVDVFEVRGHPRPRRGQFLPAAVNGGAVRLAYRGLDDLVRTITLAFTPPPARLDEAGAEFRLTLAPGGSAEITVVATAATEPGAPPRLLGYGEALRRRRLLPDALDRDAVEVRSDHNLFAVWVARSRRDLHLLLTETADGVVPYAGIPWYVAAFGRDALITALQVLPFEPRVAAGTLRFLARHVGRGADAFTDQEPGKIIHELRRGEMANCREIPFIPYYGSVDASPLFLVLLAEYWKWTADDAFLRELWPTAERVLGWMLATADAHNGYLTYARRSPRGLINQGWKDSHDAIMHASGHLAEAPIALAEAQGYQHAALLAAADVAEILGQGERPRTLRERARRFLAAGPGVLRAGARRRGPAVPGHHLESRPSPVDAARQREPGRHRGPPAHGRRHVHRLGRAHAGQRRAPLQPDELPQRLGVAARHCHRGRRHAPVRVRRSLAHADHRALRGGAAVREHAHAGALLRISARGRLRSHAVSGGVRPASLGRRCRLHADRGDAGSRPRRRRQPAHAEPPAAASVAVLDRASQRGAALVEDVGARVPRSRRGGDRDALSFRRRRARRPSLASCDHGGGGGGRGAAADSA